MGERFQCSTLVILEARSYFGHFVDESACMRVLQITNQPLKRCLTYYERQLFSGPPENSKDFIFAATEALRLGQWKECLDFISRMQFWSMIPDHVSVQQSLLQPIKRVGLRCYLWTYSSFYANIHISHLAEVFELPPKEVHRIISRMLVVEVSVSSSLPLFPHRIYSSLPHFHSLLAASQCPILSHDEDALRFARE